MSKPKLKFNENYEKILNENTTAGYNDVLDELEKVRSIVNRLEGMYPANLPDNIHQVNLERVRKVSRFLSSILESYEN